MDWFIFIFMDEICIYWEFSELTVDIRYVIWTVFVWDVDWVGYKSTYLFWQQVVCLLVLHSVSTATTIKILKSAHVIVLNRLYKNEKVQQI